MKEVMFNVIVCFSLLCGLVGFTSCSDDNNEPEQSGGTSTEGKEVNHWIEKVMREDYLWYDEIPKESALDFNDDAESFFYSLLSLKDGKTRNGEHHFYSYIEKNKDYAPGSRTSIDPDDTYGMEFVTFDMVDQNGQPLGFYWSQILYVLPGSPAAEAGLERGDWITQINGANLNEGNYTQLSRGAAVELTVMKDEDKNEKKQVPLSSSRAVVDNPLYCHTTLNVGAKKVGYLLYNHFSTGPNGFEDKTYDKEMMDIFADFAGQNVDEFVLDLRYNRGGYISCATLLASSLVGEKHKDDLFATETDNQGKKYNIKFSEEGNTPHLALNRLFVLTSSSTASASEAVINGLIPYYGKANVILLGETTEGKNVGSVHYAENKYEWAIQPIVMQITNKEGASNDYSAGFTPDYALDEFDSAKLLPLGDPEEYMLKAALKLIKGESSLRSIVPAALEKKNAVYKTIDERKIKGILLHPEEWANREEVK